MEQGRFESALFDFGDALARVEALWAHLSAVHDLVASALQEGAF